MVGGVVTNRMVVPIVGGERNEAGKATDAVVVGGRRRGSGTGLHSSNDVARQRGGSRGVVELAATVVFLGHFLVGVDSRQRVRLDESVKEGVVLWSRRMLVWYRRLYWLLLVWVTGKLANGKSWLIQTSFAYFALGI